MKKGKVYLIGAGPGDYKLLTLKALECLQKADVIVYDRLANSEYLKQGKTGCEYIDVGKASSNHTMPQDEINEVLATKAAEGKIVARLKGGDPYVFGRGGEEGEYLYDRGIAFEVIPGITSAIGGLCYAGIPITHRNCASSFHVITGHLKDENSELDWEALGRLQGTLVFLMGVANLQKITSKLMENGKDKKTPVALISWATRYNQSVVTGNLENIYETALKEGVKPPTLIVVGEVVNLREKLNFFEEKPLFGKSIMVTRARTQSSTLVSCIQDEGGRVIEFPTIYIKENEEKEALKAAIAEIDTYNYLVFTSQNAVEIFFERLLQEGKDTRALGNIKVAAIGAVTQKALKDKGILVDIMPEKAVAEALYESLAKVIQKEDKVLLPQAINARDYLHEALEKICKVTSLPIYETVIETKASLVGNENVSSLEERRKELISLLDHKEVDYITFTSASTAIYFMEILGEDNLHKLEGVRLISIGEITSAKMKELGMKVYKESPKARIESILETIAADEN